MIQPTDCFVGITMIIHVRNAQKYPKSRKLPGRINSARENEKRNIAKFIFKEMIINGAYF